MVATVFTMTRTVTINAAFLEEIKQDNKQLRALLGKVRGMCEERTRMQPRQFVSLLAELRDQIAMHFALEEAYGYFDEPVSVAPNLSEQADRLRSQHAGFYEEIRRLADTAEEALASYGHLKGTQRLARQFMSFYGRLQEHETRENDLIVQAYNVDIGVGD